jgi:hypothetical protein
MSAGNGLPPDQLRQLVREVLADVVGKPPPQAHGPARGDYAVPAAPPTSVPRSDADKVSAAAAPQPRSGPLGGDYASWTVRISTDEDLNAFALRVLKLAGNPKLRQDLISGRARFRLAAAARVLSASTALPASTGQAAAHRVDKGAVTERTVAAAAAAGARLVLGPRAVLTPLGRDKARALGVPIEKER